MRQNYYELLNLDIEFLQLKSYSYNLLNKNSIYKIGDLINFKLKDIENIKGMDDFYREDIVKKVHNFYLCFSDELVKTKNYYEIIDGLKTYNLRKKFNILINEGKKEALNVEIEVLALLPYEYGLLKSLNIYTIKDLLLIDEETISKYFTTPSTKVIYNKIINEVHNLGLSFSKENDIYLVKMLNKK